VKFNLNEEARGDIPLPTTISVSSNQHMTSGRKFPGDFANFQKISKRKNNYSRFPGVLDTLYQLYIQLKFIKHNSLFTLGSVKLF